MQNRFTPHNTITDADFLALRPEARQAQALAAFLASANGNGKEVQECR